jgi:predicted short-subunit dehydrogenase-like oxidoreductase (DUF2520 family)
VRGLPGARAVDLRVVATDAELVLLAVPDGSIEEVARALVDGEGAAWSRRTVLHHAGSLGLEPLAPLAGRGAAVGVLHPFEAFPAGGRTPSLSRRGSFARIEGDRRGLAAATRLAKKLGMVPGQLAGRDRRRARAAYHAAASLLSNDLVALLDLGVTLLESAGISRQRAVRALASLARGTLAPAERGGPAAALSGPVVRGDLQTLQAQLARLDELDPDAAEIHRLLSLRLIRLASSTGTAVTSEIKDALRPAGPRRRAGL